MKKTRENSGTVVLQLTVEGLTSSGVVFRRVAGEDMALPTPPTRPSHIQRAVPSVAARYIK